MEEKDKTPTPPGTGMPPSEDKKTAKGPGRGKRKETEPGFMDLRQQALEILIKLQEGDNFHLSFETQDPQSNDKPINYWN